MVKNEKKYIAKELSISVPPILAHTLSQEKNLSGFQRLLQQKARSQKERAFAGQVYSSTTMSASGAFFRHVHRSFRGLAPWIVYFLGPILGRWGDVLNEKSEIQYIISKGKVDNHFWVRDVASR